MNSVIDGGLKAAVWAVGFVGAGVVLKAYWLCFMLGWNLIG